MISIAHFSRFITSHPPRARAPVHVFTCWASFLHMLVITKPSYKHLHIHNRNTNKTWTSWCACAAVLSVKSHFKSFSFTPCGAAILIRREELHTRRRVSHVTRWFPGKWQLECLSFQRFQRSLLQLLGNNSHYRHRLFYSDEFLRYSTVMLFYIFHLIFIIRMTSYSGLWLSILSGRADQQLGLYQ